jgi:predicted nucleic acid-binding Zn ribbon protein
MPTYDYRCETNGRVVEVRHGMSETVSTWGELCERAGIEPGQTPAESPVQRLITGGYVITGSAGSAKAEAPSCGAGFGCGGGMCGLN